MIEREKTPTSTAFQMLKLVENKARQWSKTSKSFRFEYYKNQNPNADNAPILIEYLPIGIEDNQYLKALITEVLVLGETDNMDFHVSKIISIRNTRRDNYHVFKRIDSEVYVKGEAADNYELEGIIHPLIVTHLNGNLKIDLADTEERELTEDEIKEEIKRLESLKK